MRDDIISANFKGETCLAKYNNIKSNKSLLVIITSVINLSHFEKFPNVKFPHFSIFHHFETFIYSRDCG